MKKEPTLSELNEYLDRTTARLVRFGETQKIIEKERALMGFPTPKGNLLDPDEMNDERLIRLDDDLKLEGEEADRYQIKHC